MVVIFAWVNLLLLVLPVQVNSLLVVMFVQKILVSVTCIFLSKQTCGSNVCPSETFRSKKTDASKPVYDSYICLRKHGSASNVCQSKTISVSNALSSNSVSVINLHLKIVIFASNICSGKPVSSNNVHLSKPMCRSNGCQSKPTNVNILPCKPVPFMSC